MPTEARTFPRAKCRGLGLEPAQITIHGRLLPVSLRRNANARRIVLKIDRDGTGILITLPRRTGREAALAFATDQADWIERRLRHTPAPVSFAAGNTVPLRGEMHVIGHRPHQSQSIEREPGSAQRPPALWVKGEAPHLARRLRDWLKSEARRDLIALCRRHAAAMGVEFRRLTVRDQTSRWGSCSASGALSFSWRLILAPRDILEYVVVHEVAHLVEMNHGPRFWSLVDRNFPDRRHARIWLRRHGPILHSYR